jgi:methionyl-tRNA formyltransferase
MRIAILTKSLQGFASVCLPLLAAEREIEIAIIIYDQGRVMQKGKHISRKAKKVLKVGPLGALNGIRMRSWFREDVHAVLKPAPLDRLAARLGLYFETTPGINSQRTNELLSMAEADLGISLENDYIRERIFSIPTYGMINVHHEILPQFQGAQSLIWQIYQGSNETGFTIHQLNRQIDKGNILHRESLPIDFHSTLKRTVVNNYARLLEQSAIALPGVIKNYPKLISYSTPQNEAGRTFTTPTIWQYMKMVRQHRTLVKKHEGINSRGRSTIARSN